MPKVGIIMTGHDDYLWRRECPEREKKRLKGKKFFFFFRPFQPIFARAGWHLLPEHLLSSIWQFTTPRSPQKRPKFPNPSKLPSSVNVGASSLHHSLQGLGWGRSHRSDFLFFHLLPSDLRTANESDVKHLMSVFPRVHGCHERPGEEEALTTQNMSTVQKSLCTCVFAPEGTVQTMIQWKLGLCEGKQWCRQAVSEASIPSFGLCSSWATTTLGSPPPRPPAPGSSMPSSYRI